MKVIGLMGRIGSGKGTVADVLINEFGFQSVTMGDLVREEVAVRGLEPTREITTRVSGECLSQDPAYFIKRAVEKINSSGHDRWIIDGVRRPLDVQEFKSAFPDIIFIRVDVDPRIRFERMKLRGRPGFPETFEKFQAHESLEDQEFDLNETLSHADHVLNNDGTMDELRVKSRELVESLL